MSTARGRFEYLDLDLEIEERRDREYRVTVRSPDGGEVSELVDFPYDELGLLRQITEVEMAVGRIRTSRHATTRSAQTVRDFGQKLFEFAFSGRRLSQLISARLTAAQQNKSLRLRLHIDPPKLAALPWELLYDSDRGSFLATNIHSPIVRHPVLPVEMTPINATPPIRILAMIASPSDLDEIDVEREKKQLEQAVAPLREARLVELTWVRGSTWRDLQRELVRGPWHVFHFIGHGGFDEKKDEGVIALIGEDGRRKHFVTASQLATLLENERDLRLVVLNSCEGGRSSSSDVFSSTAATLIRKGIPGVIAMQFEISDMAALEFARTFYAGLFEDGLPVDAAVAYARTALIMQFQGTVEWATPVLYLRAPHGELFSFNVPTGHAVEDKGDGRQQIERNVQEEVARVAREQAEAKARDEARRKAQEEAERVARKQAEAKARDEAQRKAQEEAERVAREQAEAKTLDEAQRKAREEAERVAREQAEARIRDEALRKGREEAEHKTRDEAARRAREKAERKQRERVEHLAHDFPEIRERAAPEPRVLAETEEGETVDAVEQGGAESLLTSESGVSENRPGKGKSGKVTATPRAVIVILGLLLMIGLLWYFIQPSHEGVMRSQEAASGIVPSAPEPVAPKLRTTSPQAGDSDWRVTIDQLVDALVARNRQQYALRLNELRGKSKPFPVAGGNAAAKELNNEGLAAFKSSDYSSAFGKFDAAERLDPGNSEYANNAGTAKLRLDDPAAAEGYFVRAIVLQPDRWLAWSELGEAKFKRGETNRGVACLVVSLKVAGNNLDRAERRAFNVLLQERLGAEVESQATELWNWARSELPSQ
jgi:CHAT domain-containing protein